jgi:hypothetical protein
LGTTPATAANPRPAPARRRRPLSPAAKRKATTFWRPAVWGGRPGAWTCDDAEAARLEANETALPRGVHGPTPGEAWEGRRRLDAGERAAFAAEGEGHRREARRAQGYGAGAVLDRTAGDRVAIRDALVARGLLRFRPA